MKKLATTCLAGGLFGLLTGQASAALSSADRTFAQQAAASSIGEVQAAQAAQQKAASPQVRQFASRIINDHTQANDQLQQIADQDNLTLPSQPDARDRSAMQRLSGLNGSEFDRSYAQQEVRDHQQAIALFQHEASSGHDPALKQFAQQTLPVLRQHLQMAQMLAANSQR